MLVESIRIYLLKTLQYIGFVFVSFQCLFIPTKQVGNRQSSQNKVRKQFPADNKIKRKEYYKKRNKKSTFTLHLFSPIFEQKIAKTLLKNFRDLMVAVYQIGCQKNLWILMAKLLWTAYQNIGGEARSHLGKIMLKYLKQTVTNMIFATDV